MDSILTIKKVTKQVLFFDLNMNYIRYIIV
jgi:hypothetical protein